MKNELLKAYACFNKDDIIRRKSTSGGIFYLFASWVIEQGGLVAGAIFDDEFRIKHSIVDNLIDLEKVLGSKYPQSSLGYIFKDISKRLSQGKLVMFCGTPCQNNGLISYLGGKPENLWLIDFVCHGVASPELWKEYLDFKRRSGEINDIRFKDKKYGWKNWHVHFQFKSFDTYEDASQDLYMKSYLAKINIRPSCYNCKFKGLDRATDLTLADCWGIGEQNVAMNDDKGLSALMIHSERALQLFDSFSEQVVFQEYDPQELFEANWAATKSAEEGIGRYLFFEVIKKKGTMYALNYFWGNNIRFKIMRKIKGFRKI